MENTKKGIDYRWIIIIILLLASVGLYFYQNYKLSHLRKNLSAQADTTIINQGKNMLKIIAKPLVWAIREEMLRNNLDEINIFNTDLVKERNITEVTLINSNGKIINSSDKKVEGSMAKIAGYDNYLSNDTVQVLQLNDSTLRLVAPVMGYQSKLGTLILSYEVEKFNAK